MHLFGLLLFSVECLRCTCLTLLYFRTQQKITNSGITAISHQILHAEFFNQKIGNHDSVKESASVTLILFHHTKKKTPDGSMGLHKAMENATSSKYKALLAH